MLGTRCFRQPHRDPRGPEGARRRRLRRHPDHQRIIRHIPRHDRTRPHERVTPDRHAAHHRRVRAGAAQDQRERRRIHLLLMRQFIHQMVVEYEFQVNLGDTLNQQNAQGKDAGRNQGNSKRGS